MFGIGKVESMARAVKPPARDRDVPASEAASPPRRRAKTSGAARRGSGRSRGHAVALRAGRGRAGRLEARPRRIAEEHRRELLRRDEEVARFEELAAEFKEIALAQREAIRRVQTERAEKEQEITRLGDLVARSWTRPACGGRRGRRAPALRRSELAPGGEGTAGYASSQPRPRRGRHPVQEAPGSPFAA